MRVQTLLNKNSKLNPSGGARPPIRFFFFFFLLQATAQKYLWLQRNMEKKNKSRVDLRFRDLTQRKQVEAFVHQVAVLYRPFLLGYLLMILKTFSYPSASLVLSSSSSVTSLQPPNTATYLWHQNTSRSSS